MFSEQNFQFLNDSGQLNVDVSWTSGKSRLWIYNLHYFDDLNAEGASDRVAWHDDIIDNWISSNPVGFGPGWEPYTQSRRIVNWIKWHLTRQRLSEGALLSIAAQIRHLSRQIEWHLMGNHLFANAKALVFAGVFFRGPEADSWMKQGMLILAEQVNEQVLSDGGHFERSPMYHAIVYEDLLDLYNLSVSVPTPFEAYSAQTASWAEKLCEMGHWLNSMCHPDGKISFFNDCALDVALPTQTLNNYADYLSLNWRKRRGAVTHLISSGYIRVERGNAVFIIDVAPLGPDYLLGHAHADTLSFEMSLRGHRVIVNSGTSTYEDSWQRLYERGTVSHNTVTVDDKNSSEVWKSFRVARRAKVSDLSIIERQGCVEIYASHNGYSWMSKQPSHSRKLLIFDNRFELSDLIYKKAFSVCSRIYFHPDIKISITGREGFFNSSKVKGKFDVKFSAIKVRDSMWHPYFNTSVENKCLDISPEVDGEGLSENNKIYFSLSYQ